MHIENTTKYIGNTFRNLVQNQRDLIKNELLSNKEGVPIIIYLRWLKRENPR